MSILGVIALVLLVTVVYPRVQERREHDIVKRLEQEKNSTIAMIELENISRVHRHEAGFFRAIAKYLGPYFLR